MDEFDGDDLGGGGGEHATRNTKNREFQQARSDLAVLTTIDMLLMRGYAITHVHGVDKKDLRAWQREVATVRRSVAPAAVDEEAEWPPEAPRLSLKVSLLHELLLVNSCMQPVVEAVLPADCPDDCPARVTGVEPGEKLWVFLNRDKPCKLPLARKLMDFLKRKGITRIIMLTEMPLKKTQALVRGRNACGVRGQDFIIYGIEANPLRHTLNPVCYPVGRDFPEFEERWSHLVKPGATLHAAATPVDDPVCMALGLRVGDLLRIHIRGIRQPFDPIMSPVVMNKEDEPFVDPTEPEEEE